MANLGKSNTLWDQFWDRFFFVLRLARWAKENRDRVSLARVQTRVVTDPKGNTGGPVVVVGARPRVNTTPRFTIYARVTGAGDPRTVDWYKTAGAADKIATGTGNAGAVVAMAAENASGVSGSHKLAAAIVEDDDDLHVIEVYEDWRPHAAGIFDGTDPEGEDGKSLQGIGDGLDRIEGLLDEVLDEVVAMFDRLMLADPANKNELAYGARFLGQAYSTLLSDTAVGDSSTGSTTRRRGGFWEALRQAMADETTGSTQDVLERIVACAAFAPKSTNGGQLTLGSHTPEPHMPTGVVRLTVVNGLGNGFGGREELDVTWTSDVDDRTKRHSRRMRMGQSYKGEDGFGGLQGITPLRVFTKTGDGTHVQLGDVAAFTVSGETERNTDSGNLTCQVVASGASRIFEFYRSTNLIAGNLVARSAAVAAGAAFVATQEGASGLTINGTAGSAPTDGSTVAVQLNFLRVTGSDGTPDEWTAAVSLTSEGTISRLFAALPFLAGNGYKLADDDAAGALITDARLQANTFSEHTVEVN